ncbi:hypothetical protein INH39_06875 [Massilia violaceinigra]|uniref:Uncharacterized protein n=1 Tax=Massilia violaceinigra TaxID=2045208 RepID=A0ABY4AFR2_9BURK|nr:hypothetical protein [Massilia violaceinigra]UOD31418.1 hypothetical protein INH39_06875 [Massilia violaceinigra]
MSSPSVLAIGAGAQGALKETGGHCIVVNDCPIIENFVLSYGTFVIPVPIRRHPDPAVRRSGIEKSGAAEATGNRRREWHRLALEDYGQAKEKG